jgi:hypothetical protein
MTKPSTAIRLRLRPPGTFPVQRATAHQNEGVDATAELEHENVELRIAFDGDLSGAGLDASEEAKLALPQPAPVLRHGEDPTLPGLASPGRAGFGGLSRAVVAMSLSLRVSA